MRDLYRQLGVDAYAPAEALRAAMKRKGINSELRADAEAVLLVLRRRSAYDRAHRLLTVVGDLRRRTDLHLRPFWARSGNQDFTGANSGGRTRLAEISPPARSHRWVGTIIVIVVIAAIVAGLFIWKRFHT